MIIACILLLNNASAVKITCILSLSIKNSTVLSCFFIFINSKMYSIFIIYKKSGQ